MKSSPASPATAAPAEGSEPGASPQVPCDHAISFSHEQVSDWAGLDRPLTDDERIRLQDTLPMSPLPDVVNTVAYALFAFAAEEAL